MFNYSNLVQPFINERAEAVDPVPRAHVRIAATLDASRTMRDKANQRVQFGKSVTRCLWFVVAPEYSIRVWADKQGAFSFGEGYVDIPRYQADKMGILGDYMSVRTIDGVFSKKEQNEMSAEHGGACKCLGEICYLPF